MFQRITVLALIALFSVFALTVSTHAAFYWNSGSDPAYPATGYATVSEFSYSPGQVLTRHSVWCYNYSPDDDIACEYTFEAQVLGHPWLRNESLGSFVTPHKDRNGRTRARSRSGALSIGVGGLRPGEYTLSAYTQLKAGGMTIKASGSETFDILPN